MTIWTDFATALLSFNILGWGILPIFLGLLISFVFTMSRGVQQMKPYLLLGTMLLITVAVIARTSLSAEINGILATFLVVAFIGGILAFMKSRLAPKKEHEDYPEN